MEPKFFSSQNEFRKWLEKNHETAKEVLVGFWKVGTGKPSMTWGESVDQALCFGWIDGIRRSLGDEAYTIRFTPRKPTSIWSAINIKKVAQLNEKGLMRPAGDAAFEKRNDHKSRFIRTRTGRRNSHTRSKRCSGKIRRLGSSSPRRLRRTRETVSIG
ncbi:MAG TPA: hypothetical protein VGQ55_02765 [Pyrinomonadaceae bacterium]|jgi:uncharacterized protein YdeI (YjbR/CyaY-like superfamily)|nr:hypothetical protein [Pyrinomonadaceae bacterium]